LALDGGEENIKWRELST